MAWLFVTELYGDLKLSLYLFFHFVDFLKEENHSIMENESTSEETETDREIQTLTEGSTNIEIDSKEQNNNNLSSNNAATSTTSAAATAGKNQTQDNESQVKEEREEEARNMENGEEGNFGASADGPADFIDTSPNVSPTIRNIDEHFANHWEEFQKEVAVLVASNILPLTFFGGMYNRTAAGFLLFSASLF